jgi:hypothetical protein
MEGALPFLARVWAARSGLAPCKRDLFMLDEQGEQSVGFRFSLWNTPGQLN